MIGFVSEGWLLSMKLNMIDLHVKTLRCTYEVITKAPKTEHGRSTHENITLFKCIH